MRSRTVIRRTDCFGLRAVHSVLVVKVPTTGSPTFQSLSMKGRRFERGEGECSVCFRLSAD
jgi:hypothetical protein